MPGLRATILEIEPRTLVEIADGTAVAVLADVAAGAVAVARPALSGRGAEEIKALSDAFSAVLSLIEKAIGDEGHYRKWPGNDEHLAFAAFMEGEGDKLRARAIARAEVLGAQLDGRLAAEAAAEAAAEESADA